MYIGIGSNIDAEAHLHAAAALLVNAFPVVRFSSVYRSKALEVTEQDDFLNAAALLETDLAPEAVAKKLRAIEKKLKKKIAERFGPRTIDLDVLLYDQEISLDDALTIPHLALHARKFVLLPLIDLGAGDMLHPGFDRTLSSYLSEVERQDCKKTAITLP